MYDYLIVGSGLFGAVFAHEAKKAGKFLLFCWGMMWSTMNQVDRQCAS